jgi:hypothetical protein
MSFGMKPVEGRSILSSNKLQPGRFASEAGEPTQRWPVIGRAEDISGLHELIVPGAIPYETIYIGEDEQFRFVLANCFEYGEKRGERNCRVSMELTDYLVLNVGIPERDLARWRQYMLAARALTMPMIE